MAPRSHGRPASGAAGVRGLILGLVIFALVAAAASAGCRRANMPDLIIESVCYRPAPSTTSGPVANVGERLAFAIRIKNIGDAPAHGELYIDMGKSAEDFDKPKGSRIKEDETGIAPGEVFETSLKATISIHDRWNRVYFLLNPEMELQTFTVIVEGDAEDIQPGPVHSYRLEESNYRNNTYELEIVPYIKPFVRNVDDTAFTVMWTSESAEEGYVNYGTTADTLDRTVHDIRGESTRKRSHHVPITGLSAGTTYYYEFVSGDTTYRDYCDAAFEAATGPALRPREPDIISGNVYAIMSPTDRTAEARVSVEFPIQDEPSQWLSTVPDENGAWSLDIGSIRTADYESYYMYSDADRIHIYVYFGYWGGTSTLMTVAEARALASERAPPVTAE